MILEYNVRMPIIRISNLQSLWDKFSPLWKFGNKIEPCVQMDHGKAKR